MGKLVAHVRVMMGKKAELDLPDFKTHTASASYLCVCSLFIWINFCIDMLTEPLNQVLSLYRSLIELPSGTNLIHYNCLRAYM